MAEEGNMDKRNDEEPDSSHRNDEEPDSIHRNVYIEMYTQNENREYQHYRE